MLSLEKLLRPHLKQNRPTIAGMSSNEDAGGSFDMVGMVRQYGNYGRGRNSSSCVMVLTMKVRRVVANGKVLSSGFRYT